MSKKLTQEEAELRVQAKCKEKGYTCGEFTYINNKTYLPLTCNEGHPLENTTYNKFINSNSLCKTCFYENRKLTQKEAELRVQSKCKEKGYTCGEFVYIGNKTYLPLICDKGHELESATYRGFITDGYGCHTCYYERIKLTQEEAELRVQSKCKEKGYTCGEFTYVGKNTYLPLICDKGHELESATFNNFINNSSCKTCDCENRKLTQEEAELRVQAKCKEKGYTCGEFVYIGNKTYLPLICDKGHELESATYSRFIYENTGCGTCAITGFKPNESGCYYIHKIINEIVPSYKAGISNYYVQRFNNQLKNLFKPERFKCFWSIKGTHVQKLENKVKNKFKSKFNYLPKKWYEDGYTETFHENSYENIIQYVYEYIEEHNKKYPNEPIIELEMTDGEFIEPVIVTEDKVA